MRTALLVAGVALALTGLLWLGQGLGYIRWPASSFMIGRGAWVNYGAFTAAAGLGLVLVARRLGRGR